MQHSTGSFSGQNDTTIFTQYWLPDQPPRAVVLLAHGIGEHSGRYAHVASALTASDYALYTLDFRGHGQSGGARLMVRDFAEFTADLRACFERARAAHPSLPVFLYGHSMGSIISLLFALEYPDDLAGLILSGTALKPIAFNRVTKALLPPASRVLPNARLIRLDPIGISRDPSVVAAYEHDPLVYHGRMPLGILGALAHAVDTCTARLPDLRLPLLALHGSADLLTSVEAANLIRERCTMPDLTIRVYEGLYHEVHNEPEQAQVLGDIVDWLNQRV